MTALRFEVEGEPEPLALEPTLNFLCMPTARKRQAGGRGAGQGVQGQRAAVHADHQHAGQGQGDLRSLARLQGCGRQPASGQPRRGARWSKRWFERCARPIRAPSHRYYAHEGQVARQGQARLLGPQRAAARQAGARHRLDRRARRWCCEAYGGFAPDMAAIAKRVLRRRAGSMRRCARARRRAPSRTRPCPRRIPTC